MTDSCEYCGVSAAECFALPDGEYCCDSCSSREEH